MAGSPETLDGNPGTSVYLTIKIINDEMVFFTCINYLGWNNIKSTQG